MPHSSELGVFRGDAVLFMLLKKALNSYNGYNKAKTNANIQTAYKDYITLGLVWLSVPLFLAALAVSFKY